jgi:DNA-binding NtrC family response regulator
MNTAQINSTYPIILIDDETSFLQDFEYILRKEGFSRVRCFENASEAFEYIK